MKKTVAQNTTTFNIETPLFEQIQRIADSRNITPAALIVELVQNFFDNTAA